VYFPDVIQNDILYDRTCHPIRTRSWCTFQSIRYKLDSKSHKTELLKFINDNVDNYIMS